MDASDSVRGATAMQFLIAVGYLVVGTITATFHPANEGEAMLGAGMPSPPFGVAVIAIGLFAVFGAYGMWRKRLWGWSLALLVDLGTAFGTAYYIFKDFSYFNAADITLRVALAAIPLGWLSLAGVREFFWRS
jgi:hypothetical protein